MAVPQVDAIRMARSVLSIEASLGAWKLGTSMGCEGNADSADHLWLMRYVEDWEDQVALLKMDLPNLRLSP